MNCAYGKQNDTTKCEFSWLTAPYGARLATNEKTNMQINFKNYEFPGNQSNCMMAQHASFVMYVFYANEYLQHFLINNFFQQLTNCFRCWKTRSNSKRFFPKTQSELKFWTSWSKPRQRDYVLFLSIRGTQFSGDWQLLAERINSQLGQTTTCLQPWTPSTTNCYPYAWPLIVFFYRSNS